MVVACAAEPPPDPVVLSRSAAWPFGTALVYRAEMETEPLDVSLTSGGDATRRTIKLHHREEVEVEIASDSRLWVRPREQALDVELTDAGGAVRQVSHHGRFEGQLLAVRLDHGQPQVFAEGRYAWGLSGMERFVGLFEASDGYPSHPVGGGQAGEVEQTALERTVGGLVDLDYGAAMVELVNVESREGVRGAVLSAQVVLSGRLWEKQLQPTRAGQEAGSAEPEPLAGRHAFSVLRAEMELRGELFRALDPAYDADYLYTGELKIDGNLSHRGQVVSVYATGPVTVRGSTRVR